MWKKCSDTYCSNMAIERGFCAYHSFREERKPRVRRHKGEREREARRFVEYLAKGNQPIIKRKAVAGDVCEEFTVDPREKLIVREVSRQSVRHMYLQQPMPEVHDSK